MTGLPKGDTAERDALPFGLSARHAKELSWRHSVTKLSRNVGVFSLAVARYFHTDEGKSFECSGPSQT
jgi:hypothetical protein